MVIIIFSVFDITIHSFINRSVIGDIVWLYIKGVIGDIVWLL